MKTQPTPGVLLTCLSLTFSSTVLAQQDKQTPQVTIQASHNVTSKTVGRTYTGIPIELVELNRHVGYGDLNLAMTSGAAELEKRIRTTAQEACKQLDKLYPLDTTDTSDRQCIRGAVDGAMVQARQAIAVAEEAHGMRSAQAAQPH